MVEQNEIPKDFVVKSLKSEWLCKNNFLFSSVRKPILTLYILTNILTHLDSCENGVIVFLTAKDDSVLSFEANKKFCLHSSFHLILNTLLEHELQQGLTNELNAS